MTPDLLDQILKSPRLKVIHDEIGQRLRTEQIARQKFRDEMTEDTRAEFINGEVVMHSPCRLEHNETAERIYLLLKLFVRRNQLGYVGHEKYLIELTRNDVEPDVMFWNTEKAAQFRKGQLIFPPPDLVVEVLSESTEYIDRGTKFEDYAAHGVTEYWIVDPDKLVVEQYVLKGQSYELQFKSGNGTLKSAAIANGAFPVEAFFDDAADQAAVAAMGA